MLYYFVLLIFLIHLVKSSQLTDFPGSADEVKSLPGLKSPTKFRHYAGYLNASEGRHLFYWFVESQNNTRNDPIVQFIAGGPGGSSVLSMLICMGPWRVTKNATQLVDIERSWNKFANTLVIDSPVFVGYSYENNSSYIHDDQTTARDMRLALNSFFKKFPHFKNNELYLTGPSYAGIYIPYLAREIVKNNQIDNTTKINLKGLAIANGAVNGLKRHAITSLYVEHYNGMIDRDAWLRLHHSCGCPMVQKVNQFCDFFQSTNKSCHRNMTLIFNDIFTPIYVYIKNKYNIDYDYEKAANMTPPLIDGYNIYNTQRFCKTPKNDYLNKFLAFYQQSLNGLSVLTNGEDCIDLISIVNYLLNPKVAKALNAKKQFNAFDFDLNCLGPYKKGCSYKVYEGSFDDTFKELIESKQLKKMIIYNGEWDLACDVFSSEWFLERLALPVVQDYRQWIVDNKVVGFTRKYAHGMSYITVRGAGHNARVEVPGLIELITKFMVGKAKIN